MNHVRELVHYPELLPVGKRGRGIRIALLDSGVYPHPDFGDRIAAFQDFVNGRQSPYDDSGHGTHVCGIAAGNGGVMRGKYAGIAPEAELIVAKILDQSGEGTCTNLVRALEWIRNLNRARPVHVLNISVGMTNNVDADTTNRILRLIDELWSEGVSVICAAGNNGPAPMTISSIASYRHVIAVGCHDGRRSGRYARNCNDYSSRGPGQYEILKPDIVAPGTGIVSCACPVRGRSSSKMYTMKSGTSMATPIVSGAMALLLCHTSERDPDTLKRRLLQSSVDLKENRMKQGWGMLHIENLITKFY